MPYNFIMNRVTEQAEQQYSRGNLLNTIVEALHVSGINIEQLNIDDLAPVDEFHIRGKEATRELAGLTPLNSDLHVLDVGCGLGGSARWLASEFQCRVTGIDLTREYIEVARVLTEMVELNNSVDFVRADALNLPFEDESFDIVWTEHAQMNIADKTGFYEEIARAIKPEGRLLFHDIFKGSNTLKYYPVPWADNDSIDFLAAPGEIKEILDELGFTIQDWEDKSGASLEWFEQLIEKLQKKGPPPLGTHLLMGDTKIAKTKLTNQVHNLREKRMATIQAGVQKLE